MGLFLFPQLALANPSAQQVAENAAVAWLALIDAGRYDESWQEAARLFKAAVAQQQWRASMDAYRTPLGQLIKRLLKSKNKRFQILTGSRPNSMIDLRPVPLAVAAAADPPRNIVKEK